MEWCKKNKARNLTENVLLAYFSSKAKNCKSSTLWSTYSMLKSTLAVKNNIDISKYIKLIAYLKKQNVGYKAKKSKIFNRNEINHFLRDAPNESYLMWKVNLIIIYLRICNITLNTLQICLLIGIAGACRRDELRKMRVQDIADKDDILIITIPDSKNGKKRTFTLTNDIFAEIDPLELFRKYASLRPSHCSHNTFFINYRLGKCSTQVVGVHTFAKIPSLIAKYLDLPNPADYTGHCYRRTSASLLADSGADILTLKRHGGWKSSTVAEGYVEDSIANKINIGRRILTGTLTQSFDTNTNFGVNNNPQYITEAISNPIAAVNSTVCKENVENSSPSASTSGVNIYNCSNCTININK